MHYIKSNESIYTNQAFRDPVIFERDKILVRQILGNRIIATFDRDSYFVDQKIYILYPVNREKIESKFLLTIISSRLLYFYYSQVFSDNKEVFPQIKGSQISQLPIPKIPPSQQQTFIERADMMLVLNRELHDKSESFLSNIRTKYPIEKVTRKLEKWWELDFAAFVKELKTNIKLEESEELMTYFDKRKSEVSALVARIDATDTEIDDMVFDLYGLTEEERMVVLESNGK